MGCLVNERDNQALHFWPPSFATRETAPTVSPRSDLVFGCQDSSSRQRRATLWPRDHFPATECRMCNGHITNRSTGAAVGRGIRSEGTPYAGYR